MKKYVLITGASGGIGLAVARVLAKSGYCLYLHFNKNKEAIEQLLEEISPYGGEYIPIQADLSEKMGPQKVADQVYSLHGIIHNAGNAHYGLLVDLDESNAEELINVHVMTPLFLTKKLLPKMIKAGAGNVIVISSIWGQIGSSSEIIYSTVKGAQISFVKSLSKETALSGIRVNGIAPGAINTSMMAEFTEDELLAIAEEIPMGKIGSPENIANTISFLISEEASYITGQIISVNGGWHI